MSFLWPRLGGHMKCIFLLHRNSSNTRFVENVDSWLTEYTRTPLSGWIWTLLYVIIVAGSAIGNRACESWLVSLQPVVQRAIATSNCCGACLTETHTQAVFAELLCACYMRVKFHEHFLRRSITAHRAKVHQIWKSENLPMVWLAWFAGSLRLVKGKFAS